MTLKPLLPLAALLLSASIALSQPPPAPVAPGPMPTPAAGATQDGRPGSGPGMGSGMRPGMMPGPRGAAGDQSGGHDRGFHGHSHHGESMDTGFHIVPPGMWWRNAGIVQRLTLTAEQTKKMDDIFQQSRIQLIDLHATLEKQNVLLEPMLSANPPDTAKTMSQIDKVAQSRADLEKATARMLLGIRGVLTPDQWTKLQVREGPRGALGGQGPRDMVAPDSQR